MQRDLVDDELDELLEGLPAIVIEGAKGVGKTASASRRALTITQLDDPAQRSIARADPSRMLEGDPPVLIDEWQLMPDSWDVVRRSVDGGAPPGSFLLTGSATPEDAPTHPGACTHGDRSHAAALAERARSGASHRQIERRALGRTPRRDRDVLDAARGLRRRDRHVRLPRASRLDRAASSTIASYETIRDAATAGNLEKPARTTVSAYRDVLERLWIVEPVAAWLPTRNRFAQLSSPPKHQLADPALAARLLGVDADALLSSAPTQPAIRREGPLLGSFFESLITLSVRVYAQAAEATVKHLRSARGEREIDLIVERADGRVVAIEVKLARDVGDGDVRHLRWLGSKLGDDLLDAMVITTGEHAYRRRDGIAVVPGSLLGP